MVPVLAFAAALALGLARAPVADDATIHWHAPSECPTVDVVAARAGRLGVRHGEASVDITAIVGGYEAIVTLARETRTLQSASCDELATAVALLLAATMIDPEPDDIGEPATSQPLPEPVPSEPDATPTTVTSAAPASVVRRERASPRAFAVRGPIITAFGTVGVGLLPRIDGGGGLGLGWTWRRASVEVGGWILAPREASTSSGATGRVMIGAASITGCARLARAWFEARPCGGIEAGGTRIRARGVEVVSGARNPWVGARAAVRLLAWVHPRVAPLVSVGAVVPLLRSDYVVGNDVLFAAFPIAFSATLGLEVALGRSITPRPSQPRAARGRSGAKRRRRGPRAIAWLRTRRDTGRARASRAPRRSAALRGSVRSSR